ncbi:hypothetical protein MOD31_11255 [Paenarthrobacter sp. TYUT067]|uniref:hypothetical protein n=1 Tax=Paenarthrobacter sp. TYUT067 TaxID=2926245 RepID=UPI0020306096|nr:hypothetical protein [Paenarthrobacter sp. TYUT067]MCM0616602.1 hypothetical protein [Paenarthrobacter sp. TYUT067]
MRAHRVSSAAILAAALALVLSACSNEATPPAANGPLPGASTSSAPSPSATPLSTSQSPSATPRSGETFTTADGTLSFRYPTGWTVTPAEGENNAYTVVDAQGKERAVLRDKVSTLANLSLGYGFDTGFSSPVPGIKGPAGQDVNLVVQGYPGQGIGSQAAVYGLMAVNSKESLDRSDIEIPAGGYFVSFRGHAPTLEGANTPSMEQITAAAKTYAESAEFQETAKAITSLVLHPEKVTRVGCIGGGNRYEKLNGISCDEAQATFDRVYKTGAPAGARSIETSDFICFYASAGEKQTGQADVICRSKTTPDSLSFEMWPN